MRRSSRSQHGFTLIELAIVLGIFALILSAIWLVVAVVYENVRQYQANHLMQSMVQNIRQLEQRITRFDSSLGVSNRDITVNLDTQGAFPVEMRINEGTANGNLNNPWTTEGNSVHVFVRAATEFGIEFKNMQKKPCIQIATKLSSGELAGLTGISINGTLTSATSLPLNLIQASALCTQDKTNTVEWRFALH